MVLKVLLVLQTRKGQALQSLHKPYTTFPKYLLHLIVISLLQIVNFVV